MRRDGWQRFLIPLQWMAPLAMVISAGLAAFVHHEIAFQDAKRRLFTDAQEDLTSDALLLAKEIEHTLHEKEKAHLQSLIGLFGTKRGLSASALFDPQGRIIAATRIAWLNGKQDAQRRAWEKRFVQLKKLRKASLHLDGARMRIDIFLPIQFPTEHLQTPPRGLLAAQLDLMPAWRVLQASINKQTALFFVTMAFFALFGAALFQLGVESRMRRIVQAAKQVAGGDLSARSNVFGRDEIGAIGEAFDLMAAQLGRSYERLRTLQEAIEQMAEAVLITDRKGRILYVNPAFTKITGYAFEDAVGKTPRILKSGRVSTHVYREMWATILAGRPWSGRLINRRKSGETFPVIETIAPIMQQGQVQRFVAVMQDVSEMEALEQKLLESQKMEALGTLVGGVAHDFNNMLAGITGSLYLLKNRLSGTERALVERVEQLANRAAEMIRQMMAFARKDTVSFKCFDLGRFVKEAMRTARVIVPENVKVSVNISNEPMTICADGTQLQQMLMNLLNNARDAVAGKKDACIEVRVVRYQADESFFKRHPEVEAYDWAVLAVRDNGCGIDEATKARIFDPFFTTKEVGKGTGLGLAMVHGAMQRHGGVIEVDSALGQGTEFRLIFPLVEDAVAEDTRPDPQQLPRGNGECVLLADDEPAVRLVLAEILEEAGYRVLVAEDGMRALAIFEDSADEIDAAVLDVVMPSLSGVEVAEAMRKRRPLLPVIWITGYDRTHVLGDETTLPPLSKVRHKPVHIGNLLKDLQALIQQAKQAKKA